jgi:hypothetical protein
MAPPPASTNENAAIDAHSRSALATTKRNLRYLYDPKTAPTPISSRRTRTALRVLRSSLIFVFWRLVRYAKYVAIGSLIATIGAGAFGTVISGAGFVLAPTGILGTVMAGSVWGVGRMVLKRVKRRFGEHGEEVEEGHRWGARRMESNVEVGDLPW